MGRRGRLLRQLAAGTLVVLFTVGLLAIAWSRLTPREAGPSAVATTQPSPAASAAASQLPLVARLGLDWRAAAALAVLTSDPTLLGFGPRSAGGPSIGADRMYYEVTLDGTDALIRLHAGWGDCPSGCTSVWDKTYRVTPDGIVQPVSESQPTPPAGVLGRPSGDGHLRFSIVDDSKCLSAYQSAHAAAGKLDLTVFRADGTEAAGRRVASCVRGEPFTLPAGVYVVRVVDTGGTKPTGFATFSVGDGQEVWTGFDFLSPA